MRPTPPIRPRRLSSALLLAALALAALPFPVRADPPPASLAAPDAQQTPGDTSWPLGPRGEHGVALTITATPDADAVGGRAFRIELPPRASDRGGSDAPMRACAGLASALRRNLHETRALTLEIRADKPLAGIVVMTSSDTERPERRDRSFGSFVITPRWRTLRLVYGDLSPLPGWPAEAKRLGFSPGDLVLRPDSTEDICVGAEVGKIPATGAIIEIRNLRFTR